jgi:hypothetical protein
MICGSVASIFPHCHVTMYHSKIQNDFITQRHLIKPVKWAKSYGIRFVNEVESCTLIYGTSDFI